MYVGHNTCIQYLSNKRKCYVASKLLLIHSSQITETANETTEQNGVQQQHIHEALTCMRTTTNTQCHRSIHYISSLTDFIVDTEEVGDGAV